MKKKLLVLLINIMLIPINIYAEELKLEWQTIWEGSGVANDFGISLENEDIIVSSTATNVEGLINDSNEDVLIKRYDKTGKLLWQTKWGGNGREIFKSMLRVENNNFIAVGCSNSTDIEGLDIHNKNSSYCDAIIVKYNQNGELIWEKSIGGQLDDELISAIHTNDGGYVVAGTSSSNDIDGLINYGSKDVIILKYDSNGTLLWKKTWGSTLTDNFQNIILTKDNYIILVVNGTTLVKYNQDGDIMWQKELTEDSENVYSSISITPENDIIAAGRFRNIDGIENRDNSSDAIIIKYDQKGNVLWYKTWGGNNYENIHSMSLTKEGDIIVVGNYNSSDIDGMPKESEQGAMILKYNKNGELLWQKSYNHSSIQQFDSVKITQNEDIIIGGSFSTIYDEYPENDQIIIIKYNKDGNIVWEKEYGGSEDDNFLSWITTEKNDIYLLIESHSKDIPGLIIETQYRQSIITKHSIYYVLKNELLSKNGTATFEQQDSTGIITPTPDDGYKVKEVIVKDTQGNRIELTLQEDGTYTFDLYDDVTIEVQFTLAIDNPKTGILDVMTILIVGFIISVTGIFIVKNYNERYEI